MAKPLLFRRHRCPCEPHKKQSKWGNGRHSVKSPLFPLQLSMTLILTCLCPCRDQFFNRKQARIVAKEQERSLKWARMAKQYTSEANEIEYSFSDHQKVNKHQIESVRESKGREKREKTHFTPHWLCRSKNSRLDQKFCICNLQKRHRLTTIPFLWNVCLLQFVSRVYKGIPDCWRAAAW